MPTDRNQARDGQYPDYVYANKSLVDVYRNEQDGAKAAKVILGEWMKIDSHDGTIPSNEDARFPVRYRGGRGFVAVQDVTRDRQLEVYFIDVDQGDSILIQTPDDRRVLIDGGQSGDALEFIVNKYRLDKKDNYIDFDAVVATHSDLDHVGGLIGVLKHPRVAVKRVFHNGLFRRTESAVDPGPRSAAKRVSGLVDRPSVMDQPELTPTMKRLLEAITVADANMGAVIGKIEANGGRVDRPPGDKLVCRRLDRADEYLPPFDRSNRHLQIEVLWPQAEDSDGSPSYRWYGSAGETVNGNSIVLRVVHGKNRVLLTGDLNEESMDDLLNVLSATAEDPKQLASDVYKAAHHGSQHFSLEFLKVAAANVAVISSGDAKYDIHGHPRAVLMGTITRYSKHSSPGVFCTELAACYRKLSLLEMRKFRKGTGKKQLYERALKGIVHLRSDGRKLCLATVHGRKPPGSMFSQTTWKWDVWEQP